MRCLFSVLFVVLAACGGNMLAASLAPVPPVHRVPADVQGRTVLVTGEPVLETRDPMHLERAKENNVLPQYRAAMIQALGLAGFRVVTEPSAGHDLVAKLALAVSEDGDRVKQTYRCGLRRPDGAEVAQIDWTWPEGTYVDQFEVLDFAAHNLATEVAKSRAVVDELRRPKATPSEAGEPTSP